MIIAPKILNRRAERASTHDHGRCMILLRYHISTDTQEGTSNAQPMIDINKLASSPIRKERNSLNVQLGHTSKLDPIMPNSRNTVDQKCRMAK